MGGRAPTPWWEPVPLTLKPIKVQGIVIRPGDTVLVSIGGVQHLKVFKGYATVPATLDKGAWGKNWGDEPQHRCGFTKLTDCQDGAKQYAGDLCPGDKFYWMRGEPGTGPAMWPGPYSMGQLKHPNFLEGFIGEIDAE